MGFAAMGMAQNAGGNNMQNLFAMGQQQQTREVPTDAGWICACGAAGNVGKFCSDCGKSKPEATKGWECTCGAVNQGKFCAECGKSRPVGAPLYKCDKCGWEPPVPHSPPKFCPDCGDIFDVSDAK